MPALAEEDLVLQQDNARSFLGERIVLLSTSLGFWQGRYQLPKEQSEVHVHGEAVERERVTTPQLKLLGDDFPLDRAGNPWLKRLTGIRSRLSALKDRLSVAYSVPGVRLVPITAARDFLGELIGPTVGSLKQELEDAELAGRLATAVDLRQRLERYVDLPDVTPVRDPQAQKQSIAFEIHEAGREFCDDLDRILQEIRQRVPQFSLVEKKIPTTAIQMRRRFYLDVVPVLLDTAGAATVTHEDLRSHSAAIEETCQRYAEAAISEMIAEPRQQLAKAIMDLSELVKRDGRITSNSFNAVRTAIEKIRLFECVATPELLSQVRDMERVVNETDPAALRRAAEDVRNAFTSELDKALDDVRADAAVSAAIAKFGGAPRDLDI